MSTLSVQGETASLKLILHSRGNIHIMKARACCRSVRIVCVCERLTSMFHIDMVNSCIVCGHTKKKGDNVSMYRFPAVKDKRQQWLVALNISEEDVSKHSRVCSKHFLHGSSSNIPSVNIGQHFATPKKRFRSKQKGRKMLFTLSSTSSSPFTLPPKRPTLESPHNISLASKTDDDQSSMCASIGEPLLSDYSIYELPSSFERPSNSALAARLEFLEAETKYLRSVTDEKGEAYSSKFRLEKIAHDDSLIRFYTGFYSYHLLLCFFEFLGPAVYMLNYWGQSERKSKRKRKRMVLDPLNQLFLTLVRLKLNLHVVDLAYRFGISNGLVSGYFITWVCLCTSNLMILTGLLL